MGWPCFMRSSSLSTAAAEYQRTEPEPTGRNGKADSPALSTGPASRPEPRLQCPPGTKLSEGKSAPAGATQVPRNSSVSQSGTGTRPLVTTPAHNLKVKINIGRTINDCKKYFIVKKKCDFVIKLVQKV